MPNLTNAPHERLIAYRVARELVIAVHAARISHSGLREQALRAAVSVGLNIAEATGRQGAADQRRVYATRGEAAETLAAMDLAVAGGFCSAASARVPMYLADRACALLTGLMRACPCRRGR